MEDITHRIRIWGNRWFNHRWGNSQWEDSTTLISIIKANDMEEMRISCDTDLDRCRRWLRKDTTIQDHRK